MDKELASKIIALWDDGQWFYACWLLQQHLLTVSDWDKGTIKLVIRKEVGEFVHTEFKAYSEKLGIKRKYEAQEKRRIWWEGKK